MRKKTDEERVWAYVERRGVEECWPWTGVTKKANRGYCIFENRVQCAPRAVLVLSGVEVPKGMWVLHKCHNANCVNPAHLYVGTVKENARDMMAAGHHMKQRNTHCPQGHEYAGADLYITPSGSRQCRKCKRARERQYLADQVRRDTINAKRRMRRRVSQSR